MADPRPMIQLVAPAGSCQNILRQLRCKSAAQLINLIQGMVGDDYRVIGNAATIEAGEDDVNGGRDDDARRASDLQRGLADDRVAAIVALRGGSWLTRILPRIDFEVLRGRTNRVALFGFSELTTVINIAAAYPRAVCWYDMGPGFIPAGVARWVKTGRGQIRGTLRQQFPLELAEFFADVRAMIEGRGSSRLVRGRLVSGKLPRQSTIQLAGGTLAVLISLIGTPYARSVFRAGRWLALEDVNEAPHRIDRMLAHLRLAGILERCGGLLLGDFHDDASDQLDSVLASLNRVMPRRRGLPVVASPDFGHTWPMSPLPIGRKVTLQRQAEREVELVVPWRRLATVPG